MRSLRTCGCAVVKGQECRQHSRPRPTRSARGLGVEHDRLRLRVLAEESACWICGRTELRAGDVWTADHVVPRAAGGLTVRENLRKACRSCNSSRGARR